jgi:hypothetical protein
MTQLLEQALTEIAKLAPPEQDAIAAILLEELASEQRWAKSFDGFAANPLRSPLHTLRL